MSLEDLRRQYTQNGLYEADLPPSPLELFSVWMKLALENAPQDWIEPYAMTLATSSPTGNVSARVVLLRGYDDEGFVFYTNYDSAKGEQLAANAQAALVFYWGYLERQVRVTGTVSKVSREKSKAYFQRRPRGSQIGATISRQSEPIAGREILESAAARYEKEIDNAPIPLPNFWGGYCVHPSEIEFWQGRQNRLHDRIAYIRDGNEWNLQRLSP